MWQEEGRQRARAGIPLHQAGCYLYWAEGRKSRNTPVLANSDANLMRAFITFLRQEFDLGDDRFTFRLNLYTGNGLSVRAVEQFWLSHLELPRTCLRKHTLDNLPISSTGDRKNKLPYGVGTLMVTRGTPLIQHIYGAIQEYAGFDMPDWLDL